MATEINNTSQYNLRDILGMGALRSFAVNAALYPCEVIKTNQQAGVQSSNVYAVARKLFQSKGMSGFYSGFLPHLAKGVVKQTLWWLPIAYIPPELEKYKITRIKKHLATGISVAALDAMANSPFEKWRVLASIDTGKSTIVRDFSSKGWQGAFPYFLRQCVTWSLFLIGQDHFSKQYKKQGKTEPLTQCQILAVSTKLSVIGSLIITPFDVINTLKQIEIRNKPKHLMHLLRGLPLNFFTMFIQTSATVWLMHKIGVGR